MKLPAKRSVRRVTRIRRVCKHSRRHEDTQLFGQCLRLQRKAFAIQLHWIDAFYPRAFECPDMSDSRVFISYARDDEAFALQLANGLKGRGIRLWIDQWSISPADDWDQAIDLALHNCSHFLIVLSPRAVASQQVRGELQVALDEKKKIVPVVYRKCRVPRVLRTIQHVNFTSDAPEAFNQIARILASAAERDSQATSVAPPPARLGGSSRSFLRATTIVVAGVALIGSAWYLFQQQPAEDPSRKTVINKKAPAHAELGNLRVNVNIYGASVAVDGIHRGTARPPISLEITDLQPGRHHIRVEADGYEPQEQWRDVRPREWSKAVFILNPVFSQ